MSHTSAVAITSHLSPSFPLCVCACVRACVRACVHACVACARAHVLARACSISNRFPEVLKRGIHIQTHMHARMHASARAVVCVCVCMPCLWTSGKRFELETSFFLKLYGITLDIICKSLTHPITNSKMADKMAAVKHYNWL